MAVPAEMPLTKPELFTVATDAGVMLHVPPGTVFERRREAAWQMGILPAMGPGTGLTVIVAMAMPQEVVYETMAVPAPRDVTVPVALTVATVDGETVHVPPGDVLVSVMAPPIHTGTFPEMPAGVPPIVTVAVTLPHAAV